MAMTDSDILYSDNFSKVYADRLVISTYFFPLGQNKSINLNDVRILYYENQKACKDFCKTKEWGMTLTPVWWACDMHRHLHAFQNKVHYNVVIDSGSSIRKGFTVTDIQAFFDAIKPHMSQSKFVDSIPGVGKWPHVAPENDPVKQEKKKELHFDSIENDKEELIEPAKETTKLAQYEASDRQCTWNVLNQKETDKE